MNSRKDYGTDAAAIFTTMREPVKGCARALRGLIRKADPMLSEGVKWGMPVYEKGRLVCAIRPGKDYVALQFYASGTTLRDPEGLLEGTGKRMRHVKIRSKSDIRKRLFTAWIRQSAEQAGQGRARPGRDA